MRDRFSFNKAMLSFFIVSVFQISVFLSVVVYIFFEDVADSYRFIFINSKYLVFPIVLALIFYIFLMFKILIKSSMEYSMIHESNSQLTKLNNTLRSQRHDFMNHLQVVYSLIEMDEYTDAKDYIEKIYKDIQKVNKVLKTKNPAINALIQAKMIHAEKLGIDFKINITSQLDNLPIPAWEFCKIIGNIIDNAFHALQENLESKILFLSLSEDMKSYSFVIGNNGPPIPKEIMDKIFIEGFTTKAFHGEGMGLAITKRTINRYGGTVSVSSNDILTEFRGDIPKKISKPPL